MLRLVILGLLLPRLAAAEPLLERVVIVARHGVRSPTSPAEQAHYATTPWPAWPVAPGELTPHGARGATLEGAWLRVHYAAAGLVPATGCPSAGTVSVWADGEDHRTVATGAALLSGFAPGCDVPLGHGPLGKTDPVFAAAETGMCPLSRPEIDAIVPAMTARLDSLPPAYGEGLAALRTVLASPACPATGCWWDRANTTQVTAEGVKIRGPLEAGASLAESLSLEYLEGMQGQSLGWGRLDAQRLATIMALHNLSSSIRRRDPGFAGHNAAILAHRIRDALDGKTDAKLTVFIGHDTNLDNLAGLLGVDWAHPGQPDATPPGGMLVFESYRQPEGTKTVRIKFVYQTADQLRRLTPLVAGHEPGSAPVVPRGCDPAGCPVPAFETVLKSNVPKRCWAPA
jgi:4-phytase/acid phosphatase